MSWTLSPIIDLRNEQVPDDDADRQHRTAAEILHRFDTQPGVVLADEVGMGKTYVALAVAASVLESTNRRQPVIVMVPSSVASKWRTEWETFSQRCLPDGHGLQVAGPIRRGSDLLKLLDDPPERRHHVIVVTHGALSSNLSDPFVRLALLRHATRYQQHLLPLRRPIARFASQLLNDRRFANTELVEQLLDAPPRRWRTIFNAWRPDKPLSDDPVPEPLVNALDDVDWSQLRDAIAMVPVNRSANITARLKQAREQLNEKLNTTWTESLHALNLHLPLVILDEAHHVRNDTHLAKLFANQDAERDAEALQGPLGNMFDRMLFLTATPFQLGHQELLRVLHRFHGIRWQSPTAREAFDEQLASLSDALDRARATALRFERAWARLDPHDTATLASLPTPTAAEDQPEPVRTALAAAEETRADLTAAETLLRPWVIRHQRTRTEQRRRYRTGRGILDNQPTDVGLPVDGQATLPFLLAARAQAIATLEGTGDHGAASGYYAYGLASSFEAYADTRRNRAAALDDPQHKDDQPTQPSPQLAWYLDRISAALPTDQAATWRTHPKISATINRTVDLWRAGEKTLIFCFYLETGRALRSHISRALRTEIITTAAEALHQDPNDPDTVLAELDRISERLLRSDASGYQAVRQQLLAHLRMLDHATAERVAETAIRFMRTASFIVRIPGLRPDITPDDLVTGLEHPDSSGTTLAARVEAFGHTIAQQVTSQSQDILDALDSIQTGGITTTIDHFDQYERSGHREVLLPNVRLANGQVRDDTRRRLMLTFNTPFFPEILVASSVMAEGVDLHQDCRHIIHHDLDWNPSTLEQRTGRLDRIRSKAARTNQPVVIYEPYLAGTHDEKMFRVVKDRERWFNVVMGDTSDMSERATERRAARVPLPPSIAAQLTLDLSVANS